ncbi:hypothetical protein KI387_024987 [Taxus chinensis]|uniref:Uncharacterized protein n=1 Tax=Taxus chinensis TaxID=29808 RepID=A0AA38G758_TAXCH|nr:hypothetical protein KI387_024987 [Taxus chinensis]
MAQIPGYSFNRKIWSPEEDSILTEYIKSHGEGHWTSLPLKAGLKRRGKSCRLRWFNYLHPKIKRGRFSGDEEELIIRLHRLLGNRWSLIAKRLPGRTDNDVKNYWNTHLRKQFSGENSNRPTDRPIKRAKSKGCYWNSSETDKVEKSNVIAKGKSITECEPCKNKIITETAGCFLDKHSIFCQKKTEEEPYHDTVQQSLESHEPVSIFSERDLLHFEINSDTNYLFYPDSISPLHSSDFCDFWGCL